MARILLVLAALLWGSRLQAAEMALDLLDAPVPYTADFMLSSAKGTFHGQVWHAKGRERRDVSTTGGGQGVLIRRDTNTAHLLGLSGRWHVALSIPAAAALAGGLDSWTTERQKVREESVAGQRATRWKVQAEGPRGGFDGDIWINRDGIVVKAAGTVSSATGDDSEIQMSLSNLRVGSVDARMLEIPQGWLGFDLSQVPAERVEQAVNGLKPLLQMQGKR
ncbi:conserved exported hypothetical protein [Candidatus Terasakiella magnetica]|nr:conserved exported hypothetical protein [Candidatus Terasakiella magnetica]